MNEVPDTFSGLFWGYTAIWIILGAYILVIFQRLRSLEKRVREQGKPS